MSTGANSTAGRRSAVLIFVMCSILRPMARIITEPQHVISAMAASDSSGAITCARRASNPCYTNTGTEENSTPSPSETDSIQDEMPSSRDFVNSSS